MTGKPIPLDVGWTELERQEVQGLLQL